MADSLTHVTVRNVLDRVALSIDTEKSSIFSLNSNSPADEILTKPVGQSVIPPYICFDFNSSTFNTLASSE